MLDLIRQMMPTRYAPALTLPPRKHVMPLLHALDADFTSEPRPRPWEPRVVRTMEDGPHFQVAIETVAVARDEACWTCGGMDWWRGSGFNMVCRKCHPPG